MSFEWEGMLNAFILKRADVDRRGLQMRNDAQTGEALIHMLGVGRGLWSLLMRIASRRKDQCQGCTKTTHLDVL